MVLIVGGFVQAVRLGGLGWIESSVEGWEGVGLSNNREGSWNCSMTTAMASEL